LNPLGLVAACAAFAGIWAGHVAVRKIEANAPAVWVPAVAFVLAGLALEGFALSARGVMPSAGAGILGITLLWDALELWRQEQRVRKGHAPANPANARHRKMLEAPGTSATTFDLLRRTALVDKGTANQIRS
jgi:hypothetical protein